MNLPGLHYNHHMYISFDNLHLHLHLICRYFALNDMGRLELINVIPSNVLYKKQTWAESGSAMLQALITLSTESAGEPKPIPLRVGSTG